MKSWRQCFDEAFFTMCVFLVVSYFISLAMTLLR